VFVVVRVFKRISLQPQFLQLYGEAMDFRIRQLQCFLVLAEKLNYGQAARSQFMTQPTLSFQIKSLEQDFGARLFDRNPKGVTLTHAGKQLVSSARRILAEVESVQREISGIASKAPLRVCCSQAGQFEILPKVIRQLAESEPDLRIEIETMIPEERVQALVSGKLDALMMVAPVQAPGVTFQLLRREALIAVLPDTPENRARTNISVHEFATHPLLVANERECSYCKQLALGMMQRLGLSPEMVETPVNMNFQCAMVAAGKGVCFSSESLLGLRFPGVVFVPFQESLPRTRLGVAWRTKDTSASLQIFHEALVRAAYRPSRDMERAQLPVFADIARLANLAEIPQA
jgi:DNA-binding transcriptional LysR family regulator